MDSNNLPGAVAGCVWGTAIGDALGLPCEGLSPRRVAALFGGVPDDYRFAFRRGMVSDDTEHTLLVLGALAASAGVGEAFTKQLARGLRRWIAALPAGVGLATLRAGVRLCFGVSPDRAGVFSAGNGAAMRTALIGVACAWDDSGERLRDLVRRSSRLTHTDPKAEYGARAVAVCAACFARHETNVTVVLAAINNALPEPEVLELRELVRCVGESIATGTSPDVFATQRFGNRGVSGYVYQTVPVALHAALSHPRDLRAAVRSAIACGGDTDTVAAITGGIVGANVGASGIPDDLRRGIWEPTGVLRNVEARAQAFAGAWQAGMPQVLSRVPYPFALTRNAVFAAIVLTHGFRRMLPPRGK